MEQYMLNKIGTKMLLKTDGTTTAFPVWARKWDSEYDADDHRRSLPDSTQWEVVSWKEGE